MRYGKYRPKGRKVKPKPSPPPVPPALLAKRLKRYTRIYRVLRAKAEEPGFWEQEEENQRQLSQVLASKPEKDDGCQELFDSTIRQIDAIYTRESARYQSKRGLLDRLFGPKENFLHALSRYATRPSHFSPTGSYGWDDYKKSYGPYRQSVETWKAVVELEKAFVDERVRRRELLDAEHKAAVEAGKTRFALFKYCGYTIFDALKVKTLIVKTQAALAKNNQDETSLRRVYGVDDTTIAQAAAYVERTRKHVEKHRTKLQSQLNVSALCPYCGEGIGDTPHAEHIVPVSLGGLSTIENLVLVCSACNLKKSNRTVREFASAFGLDREEIERRLLALGKRV